mgnify:CR=1 FL=1
MSQKASRIMWWSLLPCFLAFAFFFPRLLISQLGPSNPWTSYLYLYGFGFFYTGSGLLLAIKSGACKLSRPRDRYWFNVVLAGFVYFAGLHALWIYLSLSIPFKGAL